MKKKIKIIFCSLETILLILLLLLLILVYIARYEKKELFREESPDGNYKVEICQIGLPDWPFGKDHIKVNFYKIDASRPATSFTADVANDGARAFYTVEWVAQGAKITLWGSEQSDAVYILPYES